MFAIGFFTSIFVCFISMLHDPYDQYKVQERLEQWDNREIKDIDKPMGYERTLKKQREANPHLYDA